MIDRLDEIVVRFLGFARLAAHRAAMASRTNIPPDAPRAKGAIAHQESRAYCGPDHHVCAGAHTWRSREPHIVLTPRDPERLARHIHRPRPSVFRHKAELHVDSVAK